MAESMKKNPQLNQEPSAVASDESVLVEASGCLTSAGIEAFLRAAPGEMPRSLADHLSTCERCQTRLLAGHDHPRAKRRPPPIWRMLVVLAMMLLVLSTFAYLVYWLANK
jgi:hypothetical protein